jgi:hypothetical protein
VLTKGCFPEQVVLGKFQAGRVAQVKRSLERLSLVMVKQEFAVGFSFGKWKVSDDESPEFTG